MRIWSLGAQRGLRGVRPGLTRRSRQAVAQSLVLRCHSTCQTEINPAVVPVNLRVLTEQAGISG